MTTIGARTLFFDMPASVVAAIEAALDDPVVTARSAPNGFSPGPAGACQTAGGRTVFVKACCDQLSPFATAAHRQEATVLALLPADHPSPSLLATVEQDGWFVIITDHIKGRTPTGRIEPSEVEAVLRLVTSLAEAGTPSPTDRLPRVGTDPGEVANRDVWAAMVADGAPPDLDRWSTRRLGVLADLEADWVGAVAGDSLVHRDLRPDNMVLTASGGVAVDWPAASRGAAWVDLVGLLPSLAMLGGPSPHEVFDHHPVGASADRAAVDCCLAMLTGYFIGQARKPPIPNVPGLRRFQADQGEVCRKWLSHRLGWDPPEADDRITIGR